MNQNWLSFRAWLGAVKMNEKLTGMLIGVLLTIGILTLFGITAAHTSNSDDTERNNIGMMGHMSMMNGNAGCEMMNSHKEMTAAEMDQDGDGFCDMCGMLIEECLDMKESGNMMGCHMMK